MIILSTMNTAQDSAAELTVAVTSHTSKDGGCLQPLGTWGCKQGAYSLKHKKKSALHKVII